MDAENVEETLRLIWMDVLGLDEAPDVNEDFFAVGGTSLQVFQVTAAMQAQLSMPMLPPTFIHTHRTIYAAARAVVQARLSGGVISGPTAQTWPNRIRPLSANQQQMWALHRSDPHSSAYNVCFLLCFEGGNVDAFALGQALTAVAKRQETLR